MGHTSPTRSVATDRNQDVSRKKGYWGLRIMSRKIRALFITINGVKVKHTIVTEKPQKS